MLTDRQTSTVKTYALITLAEVVTEKLNMPLYPRTSWRYRNFRITSVKVTQSYSVTIIIIIIINRFLFLRHESTSELLSSVHKCSEESLTSLESWRYSSTHRIFVSIRCCSASAVRHYRNIHIQTELEFGFNEVIFQFRHF